MRFFPFIQKALMVLKPKGIWPEIINLNLRNKLKWFLKMNWTGLVSVLGDSQGHLIPKSIITCEYLEEEYQEKKLFADDRYRKVCQRMTFKRFSKEVENKPGEKVQPSFDPSIECVPEKPSSVAGSQHHSVEVWVQRCFSLSLQTDLALKSKDAESVLNPVSEEWRRGGGGGDTNQKPTKDFCEMRSAGEKERN
ncbi:Glutathione S-transferase omega-1 [Lemmus lemmus]